MTKHQARLEHLAVKLSAMYGAEDPDAIEVRNHSLAVSDTAFGETLRYANLTVFDDRAARLARIPGRPL